MALFHQIKRADEIEEIRRRQEMFVEQQAKTDPNALQNYANIRGRKPDPNAKKLLTLRLDPDVIEHFKATGEGWQTRMNEALRKAAGLTCHSSG